MGTFTYGERRYAVDAAGFLEASGDWDASFACGMAPGLGIPGGLTDGHLRVIQFIREDFAATGRCPQIYKTCRAQGLRLVDLKALFPTGYLRGACKAAGLTYREADLSSAWLPPGVGEAGPALEGKTYRIDAWGFLVDATEWNEAFAVRLAQDLKMPAALTDRHWRVIRFLRDAFRRAGVVPTVYETCETLELALADLEELFPDGYHRGAVRIAGLCAR